MSLALGALGALGFGCGADDAPEGADPGAPDTQPRLQFASDGSHLVDGEGRTLYYFAADLPAADGASAISRCADNVLPSGAACTTAWPIFFAPEVVVGEGVTASDVGVLERPDGLTQTTYKGWPLYYFSQDAAAGETKGEGVGGVWFVLPNPFYTVALRNQKLDPEAEAPTRFVTDAHGRTLYRFANDERGQAGQPPITRCNENVLPSGAVCQEAWPPFTPDDLVAPGAMRADDFGTIERGDGDRQATYQGWPLYYFAGDTEAGTTNGEGVGGVWFVLGPDA